MKTCTKCKVEKKLFNFNKDKYKKDGYQSKCKTCQNKYYLDNKDLYKKYYLDNIEQIKQYYLDNIEKIIESHRQYRLENIVKRKKYQKQYKIDNRDRENENYKNRKLTNPLFKLSCNIRSLISYSIKNNGYSKKSKTCEILGCSFEEFKIHLENQFTEWMNWDNVGKWHIDHIYPVSRATDEQHLIKLNHYTNLQPLWAEDNIKKSNKI